jgi:hypothetical protein
MATYAKKWLFFAHLYNPPYDFKGLPTRDGESLGDSGGDPSRQPVAPETAVGAPPMPEV